MTRPCRVPDECFVDVLQGFLHTLLSNYVPSKTTGHPNAIAASVVLLLLTCTISLVLRRPNKATTVGCTNGNAAWPMALPSKLPLLGLEKVLSLAWDPALFFSKLV